MTFQIKNNNAQGSVHCPFILMGKKQQKCKHRNSKFAMGMDYEHYLLPLTFKISSWVRSPISDGRLVNLLFATWSCLSEVNPPTRDGKVVNLPVSYVIHQKEMNAKKRKAQSVGLNFLWNIKCFRLCSWDYDTLLFVFIINNFLPSFFLILWNWVKILRVTYEPFVAKASITSRRKSFKCEVQTKKA